MTPRSLLAFTAACLFVFLLLEVVPAGVVVLPLGLCAVGCLLVVDFPAHTPNRPERRQP